MRQSKPETQREKTPSNTWLRLTYCSVCSSGERIKRKKLRVRRWRFHGSLRRLALTGRCCRSLARHFLLDRSCGIFFFYWEGWDKQESCQRVTCHNTRVLQRGECTWLVYLVERIVSFTSQMDLQWKSWVYTTTVHTEASLDSVRALRASTRRGILHQCLSP